VWEREKEKKREWVCWGDAPTLPLLLLHNMSSWLNTGNPCTEGTSLRLVLVYALYDIYPIIRNDLACHILSTEQTSFDLSSTSIDTLKAIVAIVLGFPSDTSSRLSSFLFRQTSVWIFGFSGQSTTTVLCTRTKSPRLKGSLMKPALEHDYSVNQSSESKVWHLSRMSIYPYGLCYSTSTRRRVLGFSWANAWRCLLLVDLQLDFCRPRVFCAHSTPDMEGRCRRLHLPRSAHHAQISGCGVPVDI
jgi:hypothetical protein